ncbi:MAG TPA: CARDB domain-containing protein [Pirellulaceae bacterium]|nr:CARDB domain-containing protein [Pirellulaceae bacterium]
MSRRVITIAAVVVGLGALVAYVRAQDAATRSVLRSVDDSGQEPTLASPPTSARHIQEAAVEVGDSRYSIGDAGERAASPTATGRHLSLADRLQQVRETAAQVTGESQRPLQDAAAATGPVVANPATAAPLDRNLANRETGQGATVVSPTRVADERGAVSSQRSGNDEASAPFSARRIPRAPVPAAPSVEPSPSDFADEAPTFEEPADTVPSGIAPAYGEPQTILESPQAGPTRPQVPVRSIAGSLLSSVGPQIRVETVGPRSVMVGKPAEYSITVSNTGNVAASELYVRVSLPSWVEVQADNVSSGTTQTQAEGPGQQKLVWTIDQIEPQSQQTLKLFARPNTNRPFDLMVDWTLRPISGVAQIDVQQPRLEMALFGPKNVLYGESAVYTIQLTNPGTGDAENVALEFSYGARRLEKKVIGNIAPGEQNEINVELTTQQAGQLRVAVVATADGGLKAEANEDILVRRAELEVGVIGSSLKFAGGVATYKVRVKNIGNATANGVSASIVLPPGAKVVGAQDIESGNILQDVGALLPGAERVIGIQCQLMMPGENRIDAVVKSDGGLEKSASFTTRVEALADLKLTVSDPSGPTALGADALYEVRIVNRGTKAAERIKVVAQFSEGVEPLEANGGAADIVPGQVLFHPISRIEPGDELVLKIVAKADKPGNHRFRAELIASDPDTRLIAEESTYYFGEEAPRTAARPTAE